MIIRDYQDIDFHSVASLIQHELGYHTLTQKQIHQQLKQIQSDVNYKTLVMEEEGDVIGFAGLMFCLAYERLGTYARIIALAIREDHQGNGMGTILLQEVEKYALEQGVSDITLNSGLQRTSAHNFYEHQAYHKKGYSFIKDLSTKHTEEC